MTTRVSRRQISAVDKSWIISSVKIRFMVLGFISGIALFRAVSVFSSSPKSGKSEISLQKGELPANVNSIQKNYTVYAGVTNGDALRPNWPRVPLPGVRELFTKREEAFWQQPEQEGWKPCLETTEEYKQQSTVVLKSEIYLVAVVTGGLNQMRRQVGTAVVIARILKAALLVPVLSYNGIWKDHSEFADIFDVSHFRDVLKDDVRVVTTLPVAHLRMTHAVERQPKLDATPEWIYDNLYSQLRKDHVMIIRGLDSGLADDLPLDLQRLRCRVEFQAFKFSPVIHELGMKLAFRMAAKGPFVALHLRLEQDVWVRTGCLPGLGKELDDAILKEREAKPEMLTARANLTVEERLQNGLCPLSSAMVTRILKALGASNRTRIFWAGGEPFGGDFALAPLKEAFAEIHTKWTLSDPNEMSVVRRHANMLAALDFIIALESDVFMPSHGGNMAHVLQGHRAFFGPRKFIMPNKRKLMSALLRDVSDDEFRDIVDEAQKETLGKLQFRTDRKGRDVIGYPAPECLHHPDYHGTSESRLL